MNFVSRHHQSILSINKSIIVQKLNKDIIFLDDETINALDINNDDLYSVNKNIDDYDEELLKDYDEELLKDYDEELLKDYYIEKLKDYYIEKLKDFDEEKLKDFDEELLKDFDEELLKDFNIELLIKKGGTIFSTYHIRPDKTENDIIFAYINNIWRVLQVNRCRGIHIKISLNGVFYYAELTAKEDNKFIIAISSDSKHKYEIIHISCFRDSFIHITFLDEDKSHYRLYQKYNPRINKRFNDILIFLIAASKIFVKENRPPENFWNNNPKNNWRDNIIRYEIKIEKFEKDLYILLGCLKYIIENLSKDFFPT